MLSHIFFYKSQCRFFFINVSVSSSKSQHLMIISKLHQQCLRSATVFYTFPLILSSLKTVLTSEIWILDVNQLEDQLQGIVKI